MSEPSAAFVTVRRSAASDEDGVRATNLAVVTFYEKLGYVLEERANLGKRREDERA